MGVGRTNPASGLALKEQVNSDALIPRNNLADLPDRAAALSNLGVTSSAAELNILDGVTATAAELNLTDGAVATVTIALAASATTDGMDITITAKDAAGATLESANELVMFMSESATGLGLTGDTYSGDLTAGTGKILGTMTAKKCWLIQTHTTGIFVGTLVDSANPVDQYVVVVKPQTQGRVISAASGANWEGA